ncbi:hypothetical protein [Bacillus sp. 3255]|uniref:hypothetical protein n=1 Tax=Bacillus sp. 3255 TaxID=2817904 RepID=UPI002863C0F4|nr:hypothetical protein [Bacillus sp. 3255]MDR6882057.1 hypothetical protein [Bacillus sp. 3255]
MDPFLEIKQPDATAGYKSVGITVITAAIGVINWFELRGLLLVLLTFFGVKRSSWQGIDNFSFLFMGVVWLAYVFYCQHYLKKKAEAKQVLQASAMLLAIQLGLLFVCNLFSHVLLSVPFESYMLLFLIVEGIMTLLLGWYSLHAARRRAVR